MRSVFCYTNGREEKNTMADLREQLDRVFSVFIRISYADWQGYVSCYTCGRRLPWQEAQCGHFIRRGHSSVRFHEDNCRPQCIDCNEYRGGMEDSFEEHLRDDLGDEAVDLLIALGRTEKQFTDDEYRDKIHYYRSKIKEKGVII